MENNIHNTRVKIESLSTLVSNLTPAYYLLMFPNINGAHTSLLLANEWVNKIIEEIQEPYPKEDIEEEFKKKLLDRWYTQELSQEDRIYFILKEIQEVVVEVRFLQDLELPGTIYSNTFIPNITTKLTEATFFLKFELERISKVK